MNKIKYTIIEEEHFVDFTQYSQLSYKQAGKHILLYVDNELVGKAMVWLDRENESREYVCINYEVVYLDTLMLRED